MGCGASSGSKDTVQYLNGKPDFKADQVIKGFKDNGNGLLFRLVNNKTKQWAYYNDTKDYEMHIKVTFDEGCKIKALGKTVIETLPDRKQVASVVVYPCETELFIEGKADKFQSKMDALPLSAEGKQRLQDAQK